jgi:hypothetical protein
MPLIGSRSTAGCTRITVWGAWTARVPAAGERIEPPPRAPPPLCPGPSQLDAVHIAAAADSTSREASAACRLRAARW